MNQTSYDDAAFCTNGNDDDGGGWEIDDDDDPALYEALALSLLESAQEGTTRQRTEEGGTKAGATVDGTNEPPRKRRRRPDSPPLGRLFGSEKDIAEQDPSPELEAFRHQWEAEIMETVYTRTIEASVTEPEIRERERAVSLVRRSLARCASEDYIIGSFERLPKECGLTPFEMWTAIFEYADVSSVVRFGTCSKACHELAWHYVNDVTAVRGAHESTMPILANSFPPGTRVVRIHGGGDGHSITGEMTIFRLAPRIEHLVVKGVDVHIHINKHWAKGKCHYPTAMVSPLLGIRCMAISAVLSWKMIRNIDYRLLGDEEAMPHAKIIRITSNGGFLPRRGFEKEATMGKTRNKKTTVAMVDTNSSKGAEMTKEEMEREKERKDEAKKRIQKPIYVIRTYTWKVYGNEPDRPYKARSVAKTMRKELVFAPLPLV